MNAGQDARTLASIPVEVRWAPVGEPAETDIELARGMLTASEFARYRALRADAALTFLAGRRLLRELVATLAAVDRSAVSIEARCPFCGGPHGRPAVLAPPTAASLHLGLAHTGSVVVAVAARDHVVGVDVELSDAVQTQERDRAIATVAGSSATDALEHWTRVEAVLKADGRGLRVNPRTVRVTTTSDTVEARIDGSEARYRLASLDLGIGAGTDTRAGTGNDARPRYTASLAVRI